MDYADIERMRQRQLSRVASGGRQARAQAHDLSNATLRGGVASGAFRGATEGIAAQEAMQAAGINEESAQLQHERQMEVDAERRAQEEQRKAEKNRKWGLLANLAVKAATAPLGPAGGSLLGTVTNKLFGKAPPAAPGKADAMMAAGAAPAGVAAAIKKPVQGPFMPAADYTARTAALGQAQQRMGQVFGQETPEQKRRNWLRRMMSRDQPISQEG